MKTLNRVRTAGVLTVGIFAAACANEAMPLVGASDDTEEAGGCGCWDTDAAGGSSGQGGQSGSSGSGGAGGSSGSSGSGGSAGTSDSGGDAPWRCDLIDCGTGYECVQDGVDHYRCIRDDDGGNPPNDGGVLDGGNSDSGMSDAGSQCVVDDPVPCQSGAYGCMGTVFPSNQYCDVPGSNPNVKLGCQCPNPNDNDRGTWLPLGVGCASVNLCWK